MLKVDREEPALDCSESKHRKMRKGNSHEYSESWEHQVKNFLSVLLKGRKQNRSENEKLKFCILEIAHGHFEMFGVT